MGKGIQYGYGYIQGANYAATEMDIQVTVRYTYLGTFGPSTTVQTKAAAWFSEGTEVIFAAAGGAGGSVFKAAEQEEGKTIGVDVDQRGESTTVITSAMKLLKKSVYDALTEWKDLTFPGGEQLMYNAANNGVGMPAEFDRMVNFTLAMYEELFADIADGTIVVDNESEEAIATFAAAYTKVTLVFEE